MYKRNNKASDDSAEPKATKETPNNSGGLQGGNSFRLPCWRGAPRSELQSRPGPAMSSTAGLKVTAC